MGTILSLSMSESYRKRLLAIDSKARISRNNYMAMTPDARDNSSDNPRDFTNLKMNPVQRGLLSIWAEDKRIYAIVFEGCRQVSYTTSLKLINSEFFSKKKAA